MKTHGSVKWMRTLGNFSYLLGVAFLIAAMAVNAMPASRAYAANVGSIWTTQETCNQPAPQDDNHYANGDTVHIRGNNFDPNVTIYWKVEGLPGSNTPGLIAQGSSTTDATGAFCVAAHTVAAPPEGGEYKYTVATCADFGGGCEKHDNYQVDEGAAPTNTPVPPTATPTNTPVPPTATPTNTPGPGPSATPTNTPTNTATPVPGIPPTATPRPSSPLIPVTGAALGGGWSAQTIFFNLGIGFLGLGLVLNGLARSRRELDL
jgi:hypothetical protein